MQRAHFYKFLVLPLVLLTLAPAAQAAFLDNLLNTMEAATGNWLSRALGLALKVFMALAVLEFVWSAANTVLKKGELSDILGMFMLKVVAIGFFYTVITSAQTWIPAVTQSFQQAGSTISGSSVTLTPSGVVDKGMAIVKIILNKTLDQVSVWSPATSFLVSLVSGITSLLIFIAYLVVALQLFVVKAEMLLVIAGGAIMLGFAGSRWTMNFAEKYIGYAVSTGAKFIVVSLLAGYGESFGQYVVNNIPDEITFSIMLSLLGSSALFGVMSYMVPGLAGSILSGAAQMSLANFAATASAGAGKLAAAGATAAGTTARLGGATLNAVARALAPSQAAGGIVGMQRGGGSAAGSISGAGGAGVFRSAFGSSGGSGGSGGAGGGRTSGSTSSGSSGGRTGVDGGGPGGGGGTGNAVRAVDGSGLTDGGKSSAPAAGGGTDASAVRGSTSGVNGAVPGVGAGSSYSAGGRRAEPDEGTGTYQQTTNAAETPAQRKPMSDLGLDSGDSSSRTGIETASSTVMRAARVHNADPAAAGSANLGGAAGAGFADPAAVRSNYAGASGMNSERSADEFFRRQAQAANQPPMDYRDEQRLREKEMRARMSSKPFTRRLLQASDKLNEVSDRASAFARRNRRHMPSDGHTGAAAPIRAGLGD
jgi:type IV secretion system protein TrbL